MNAESINPTPDPEFIKLLSEFLPHKHTISRQLPNGNTQDEVLPGTNFMEDAMRVFQNCSPGFFNSFEDCYTVEHSMWTQPYLNEVKGFLQNNNLNTDLLANMWLLRCRIYFILMHARYDERKRRNYDSEQIKNINFVRNHILLFLKEHTGVKLKTAGGDGDLDLSVNFKSSNKSGNNTITLTGHLANNMYTALQKMADSFLEANKDFAPDLHTKRFRKGIETVTIGSYKILRQWNVFDSSEKKTPPIEQLTILKNLVELAYNSEGMLEEAFATKKPENPQGKKPEDHLRRFFN